MFKKPYKSGGFGGRGGSRGFGDRGDRGGFGGPKRNFSRGGGSFDRPAMFPATCAACGNRCEVPFKPNGSKPIYCSNCFDRDGGSAPKRFGHDRGERRDHSFDSGEKRMFPSECVACGNACEVPFRPNGSKPVYCRDCFSKNGGPSAGPSHMPSMKSDNGTSEQLKQINAKLDEILSALATKA